MKKLSAQTGILPKSRYAKRKQDEEAIRASLKFAE
jgi:hypothetical protein